MSAKSTVNLRIEGELRAQLDAAASRNRRSLSAEVAHRLARTFGLTDDQRRMRAYMDWLRSPYLPSAASLDADLGDLWIE